MRNNFCGLFAKKVFHMCYGNIRFKTNKSVTLSFLLNRYKVNEKNINPSHAYTSYS